MIIGGCGYIGSAIYDSLNKNYYVDTVDLELFGNFNNSQNIKTDYGRLHQQFLDQYDTIILLAGNSSVAMCHDVFDSYKNNVEKFISIAKNIRSQKFIYASSSSVYNTAYHNRPNVETDFLLPKDSYTLTKTFRDYFMSLTDIEYYGLRLGTVNGWSKNMRLDLMINSMVRSACNNKQVNLMNGQANRPILGINDLCRAISTIIENNSNNSGIYNLASVNHSISYIGEQVADICNVPIIDCGNTETYDFLIDSSKFTSTFNFEFKDNVPSIVNNILSNPINDKWSGRK